MKNNTVGRPKQYNRRKQPMVGIRLDAELKEDFYAICDFKEMSIQEVLEKFIKQYVINNKQ